MTKLIPPTHLNPINNQLGVRGGELHDLRERQAPHIQDSDRTIDLCHRLCNGCLQSHLDPAEYFR